MNYDDTPNFYNKFLESRYNLLKIMPEEPERMYTYYIGTFKKDKNVGVSDKEYTEVERAVSRSCIEDYYPLIVNSLNKRGNWKCLNTYDAFNSFHIDFTFTNASILSVRSNINYRLLLDSKDHYISNKTAFYNKFRHYDFILSYESVTCLLYTSPSPRD